MRKKKILIYGVVAVLFLGGVIGIFSFIRFFQIKNAKVEIILVEDLTLSFTEEKRVSDYILSMNGTIIDDFFIDSTSLGVKKVSFLFKNEDGIKVPYSYEIAVIDEVAPVVWLGNSYTVNKGSKIDLTSKILCGDNEDNTPVCEVLGDYDMNQVGSYPLVFKASDRSGNTTEQKFTLHVIEPPKGNTTVSSNPSYTKFDEIVKNYKTEKTKIGIDVSGWQGDIDFDAIKEAGVEFIIIKIGNTKTDGEYHLDSKFIQNITNANEKGIDVGLYFYSSASSNEQAKKDALWVIEQIKEYQVTLPIAFDWENWSSFNEYHLSFFGLTDIAHTFLDTLKESGYDGMLYSSKAYLEKLWFPTKYDTWLAHYTSDAKPTSYEGEYKYWQVCDNGKVNGIKGAVDIDIMFLND